MQLTRVLILSLVVLASTTSLRGGMESRRDPNNEPDEDEYGDREMPLSQEDSSDSSVHQFLTDDDREGTPSSNNDDLGDADEMAKKSAALAENGLSDTEDTPDDSDSLIQKTKESLKSLASNKNSLTQDPDALDDESQFGDKDLAMGPADSFDSLPHQLLANTVEHDRISVGDEDTAENSEMGAEKPDNEDDMPEDSKSLLQNKQDTLRARKIAAMLLKQARNVRGDDPQSSDREAVAAMGGSSDSSLNQLLAADDAAEDDVVSTEQDVDDSDDINPSAKAAEEQSDSEEGKADQPDSLLVNNAMAAAAKSDQQDSDTADDAADESEVSVSQEDSSDSSVHQVLMHDDVRESASSNDDDSDDAEMTKSKDLAADDHFDSEDTVADSD